MPLSRFNLRVYGILINDQDEVLLSDELIRGSRTTKFPGGGLELGEGLRDALAREFREECGADVLVGEHFYTTDFFVASAFDSDSQVISIYYLCTCADWRDIKVSSERFNFPQGHTADTEAFRWVGFSRLHLEAEVTLIIDQAVLRMLIDKYAPYTGSV